MLRNVIGIALISLGAFRGLAGNPGGKRSLVFPPQGEKVAASKVQVFDNNGAKVRGTSSRIVASGVRLEITAFQFIIGIGLPMEVDVSLIIGYTMKFNYLLPSNASYFTDPYVRYDRSIEPHQDDSQGSSREKGGVTSRWELYGTLERALRSGKACLLRAICEAAYAPFNRDLGLTSQILHAFLTPSTTSEPVRTEFDKEYLAAEEAGRRGEASCDRLFMECGESYLEYFTDVSYS